VSWSERQRRLLRLMGITLWTPPAPAVGALTQTDPAAGAVAGSALPPQLQTQLQPPVQVAVHPKHAPPAVVAIRAGADAAAPDAVAVDLDARSRGIAGLDWTALRAAVAECRACGLHATRQQTVFGVGAPQAQWMVVGEAPGEQEDARGEPFVGPAGELLDSMLHALQLTRAQDGPQAPERRVFIANTLKCRPPRNRNPLPEELQACEPFLVRQIALVQPRIILAMGRFAIQSLLRSGEPVGKLRGRVHRYQGVPLVVTYHPAYLLRNPADKARAWDDLCLAADVAEAAGPPVLRP